MPELEPQPKPKPIRDPQALSSEYHKARRQLMLGAGILFIWELVGIDLEKAKEAGGNAGAIIKAIKSPQAVPWVLLILVGYFLFRFTIEWYQSTADRRKMRAAKIDFFASWFISLLAYSLYVGQTIRQVQFANLARGKAILQFAVIIIETIGIVLAAWHVVARRGRQSTILPRIAIWLRGLFSKSREA